MPFDSCTNVIWLKMLSLWFAYNHRTDLEILSAGKTAVTVYLNCFQIKNHFIC